MKQVFLVVATAALLASCTSKTKGDTNGSGTGDTTAKVDLPYTVNYSSSFKMGDPKYSAMILQGSWKDWENNTMDNMKSWVADTIVAYHSDNSMVMGADSLMARWKRSRDGLTSSIDSIDAVLSVVSTDKNENWVLVWARAIDTKKDGTKDTSALQETWRINKDGKADMLYQFDRSRRKQ
jgi:hypothetical protein